VTFKVFKGCPGGCDLCNFREHEMPKTNNFLVINQNLAGYGCAVRYIDRKDC
jgi:hypothetical protein